MVKVTLVGASWARQGAGFQYIGAAPECAMCQLKRVCHSLEPNQFYRVSNVRPTRHPPEACGVFEGEVQVVEVEPVLPVASIPASAARGTGVTWQFIPCELACPYKPYCQTTALESGTPCNIEAIEGTPVCKKGYDLRMARLRPVGRPAR